MGREPLAVPLVAGLARDRSRGSTSVPVNGAVEVASAGAKCAAVRQKSKRDRRSIRFAVPDWSDEETDDPLCMSRLNPTFAPCVPRLAKDPPAGPGWIHEIKHDGFRILARRDRERVRLFTRHGADFTARYPKIAAALASLSVRSCALDGEAIVVNADGLSVFDLIRYRHHDHAAVLCAFDL
jgi:ATP-dependent DNA ligase